MWLITEFEAATLFSLKMSSATSSGGKTLLVPTPFAVKMALLDAAFRTRGAAEAERLWQDIRELQIALRPSARIVVTNLFQKVLRPRRGEAGLDAPDAGPFQKTIGYREYAQWDGALGIGFQVESQRESEWLIELLLHVNYLGKRGGFVQWLPPGRWDAELPFDFVQATAEQTTFSLNGTMQVLDDSAAGLAFEKVNIYDKSPLRGKDRVLRQIVLPNFRLTRSSKSFSLYERVDVPSPS
jgi:hypothetical protein